MQKKHRILGFFLRRGWFYWLIVRAVNLNGHIRIHSIRHFIYRRIFKVRLSNNSVIYCCCIFMSPDGVSIGHHSVIGDHVLLDGRQGIIIGNNVDVSTQTKIFTLEHDIDSPTFGAKGGPVVINDWAYIGTGAIILPEVTIGEGAVVCSGAVVTKNVDPWTMVGGVPAKFIRKRPIVKYTQNTHPALFQ